MHTPIDNATAGVNVTYLFERYKDEVEGLLGAYRKLQNTFADHVGKLDGSFKVDGSFKCKNEFIVHFNMLR